MDEDESVEDEPIHYCASLMSSIPASFASCGQEYQTVDPYPVRARHITCPSLMVSINCINIIHSEGSTPEMGELL